MSTPQSLSDVVKHSSTDRNCTQDRTTGNTPPQASRSSSVHHQPQRTGKPFSLLRRYSDRRRLRVRRSDKQLLRGNTQDVAYENLLQLLEGNDLVEIVDKVNARHTSDDQFVYSTIHSRYVRAVKVVARRTRLTQAALLTELNQERVANGLDPMKGTFLKRVLPTKVGHESIRGATATESERAKRSAVVCGEEEPKPRTRPVPSNDSQRKSQVSQFSFSGFLQEVERSHSQSPTK